MKKINYQNLKNVPKREKHIRWNCEQSPDNPLLMRYHVIVVDNRRRKEPFDEIFQEISCISCGIEIIRTCEGNLGNSDLKYLFKSFDTPVGPGVIDWAKIRKGKPVRKDGRLLYERKRGKVEECVADFYA